MKKDEFYLMHILSAIDDIEDFTKNVTFDSFRINREKQNATIRSIEVIGEATKHLSKDLRSKYPQIPWKKIIGMRDILIHEYFGVKVDRIWEVVQNDIPLLKEIVKQAISDIDRSYNLDF
jgi:uncharacterized protein with HEPN domain